MKRAHFFCIKPWVSKAYIRYSGSKEKGVVIVEYVLLLVACLGVAMLIAQAVAIGSDQSESGFFIKNMDECFKNNS